MGNVPFVWSGGRKRATIGGPGNFYTVGDRIFDQEGVRFVPRGVNVGGTVANNGGGWPDHTLSNSFVQGMKQWHCNTARIAQYVSSKHSWSLRAKALAAGKTEAQADAEVDALADEMVQFYVDRGLVVILECHDMTQSSGSDVLLQVERFWERFAPRWTHEPRVWINIANEPNIGADTWLRFHDRICGVVRNAGAENMIVVDMLYYASDQTRNTNGDIIPQGWEPGRTDYLIGRWGNVIASIHNYGSYGTFVTEANIAAHIAKYKTRNIPLIYGEVGYPIQGAVSVLNWQWERDAAHSTCAVAAREDIGVFWWATAFNDAYRLEGTSSNWLSGLTNPFRPDAVLNEAGLMFKHYLEESHASHP